MIDVIKKLLLATILNISIVLAGVWVYHQNMSQEAIDNKVRKIYRELIAQTGQIQDALPLYIEENPEENAYNNGYKIVVYRGLINNLSWDEIALVLGHEIAHGMLGHLNGNLPVPERNNLVEMGTNGYIAVLEGNADKLGALYMMKAGWDICEGRQVYKRWEEKNGNYIGQSHPNYAYRYDELNIDCE